MGIRRNQPTSGRNPGGSKDRVVAKRRRGVAPPFAIEPMERRVLLTAYPTGNATVGMNLDGFSDDSTIGAFNDLSTIFRPWGTLLTPYQPDPTIPTTGPQDDFPDNYPLADAAAITYASAYPDGDYAVSYDGDGTVDFTG